MKILVIDDKAKQSQHSRKKLLDVLSEREPIKVDLVEPVEKDLLPKLKDIADYNLILVDYKFDTASSPMFKTGASLHSLLRDYTQSIPIYLISVLSYKSNQFGEFDLFIKDEVIEDTASFRMELEHHEKLQKISSAEDFKKLLNVPAEIMDDFEVMLKPFFSTPSVGDSSNEPEISPFKVNDSINIKLFRWLIQSLLHKEGVLVGKNGAALYLGVSSQYFDKISEQFEAAKYTGIFCHSLEERWWVCALEDCILDIEDPDNLLSQLPFKEAVPLLLGAEDGDFSNCVSCGKRFPEALGTISGDDDKELYHVHIACSEFDETLKQEAFFKNARIIEAD